MYCVQGICKVLSYRDMKLIKLQCIKFGTHGLVKDRVCELYESYNCHSAINSYSTMLHSSCQKCRRNNTLLSLRELGKTSRKLNWVLNDE